MTDVSDASSQDGYQWLGPYFPVLNWATGLRFSFGTDLSDDGDPLSATDFYKLRFFPNF